MSITRRVSTLFDPADIVPLGSEEWAQECRETLQHAVDRAIGGRLEFTRDIVQFYHHEGWKALRNREGQPFRTCRTFALAARPEGLMLSLRQFKAFMAEIHKAVEEAATEAAAQPPIRQNRRPTKAEQDKFYNVKLTKSGNSTDYLARRIAKNRPDILARMQAGEFPSVRAAAKEAGIIKDKTTLEQLSTLWKKATEKERAQFLQQISIVEPSP